jgi:hypothetical protein
LVQSGFEAVASRLWALRPVEPKVRSYFECFFTRLTDPGAAAGVTTDVEGATTVVATVGGGATAVGAESDTYLLCRGVLAEFPGWAAVLAVPDFLCPWALGEFPGPVAVLAVPDLVCPGALGELPAPAGECPGAVADFPRAAVIAVFKPAPVFSPSASVAIEVDAWARMPAGLEARPGPPDVAGAGDTVADVER